MAEYHWAVNDEVACGTNHVNQGIVCNIEELTDASMYEIVNLRKSI